MLKSKIFYLIITLIFFIAYALYSNLIFKIKVFDNLKSKIPYQTKAKLLKTVFIFKYAENLENELEKKIKIINKKNKIISDLSDGKIFDFTKEVKFENSSLLLKYFQNIDFPGMGPRAYFSKNNENLFLVTGTGKLYYTNLEELNIDKKLYFRKIKSNFSKLIGKENILDDMIITKGLEIIDNKIYTSVAYKKNNCYSNVILEAELNYEVLNHRIFFDAGLCIPHYNYQTGGNIVKYKENKILLTIGDYEYPIWDFFENSKLNPQTDDNFLGKFISINLDDPNITNIIIKGSRNAQGLFYDEKKDILISSEHGPQGGDEVNLIKNLNEKVNLGWPISSYGDHYGFPDFKGEYKDNKKRYIRAPLKKSHKDFGFLEPLKYFPKESPGASQVIKTNKFENYDDDLYVIYFGTLGDSNYGSKTLFKFILDKDYNLIEEKKYFVDDRVRDLIYLEESNKILLFLETSGSIGILENL